MRGQASPRPIASNMRPLLWPAITPWLYASERGAAYGSPFLLGNLEGSWLCRRGTLAPKRVRRIASFGPPAGRGFLRRCRYPHGHHRAATMKHPVLSQSQPVGVTVRPGLQVQRAEPWIMPPAAPVKAET
jgi:hypothetical protein